MNISRLLGQKINQTQMFDQKGERIPVTRILAGPCTVVKSVKHDDKGYQSIQLSFGTARKINKATIGHLKKSGLTKAPLFLKEAKAEIGENLELGRIISLDEVFNIGDIVKVTGVSKGKGFAGVVKRHGFHGGPKTHGQSDRHRAPGSIGSTTTPGRVYKGKRMAGRMGGENVSVKGLEIISMDKENNLLTVKGLVPGFKGGMLYISKQP